MFSRFNQDNDTYHDTFSSWQIWQFKWVIGPHYIDSFRSRTMIPVNQAKSQPLQVLPTVIKKFEQFSITRLRVGRTFKKFKIWFSKRKCAN